MAIKRVATPRKSMGATKTATSRTTGQKTTTSGTLKPTTASGFKSNSGMLHKTSTPLSKTGGRSTSRESVVRSTLKKKY